MSSRPSSAAPRVLSVFGTRPEAIKMAPVVRELERRGLESRVCVTGQHREMLDEVLEFFSVTPDYDLNVMRPGQSPTAVAAAVLDRLEPILQEEQPDWVLVQGDTTTAAVAGFAAFYAGARVGHVEAGLRSHTPREPFPEEINRRVAGVVADLHFAPTETARENLRREGVAEDKVLVTGNPVIDALYSAIDSPAPGPDFLDELDDDTRLILVTTHRRESFGDPLRRICRAVRALAETHDDVQVVLPVHPNPAVSDTVMAELGGSPRIRLVEPLSYPELAQTLNRAHLVLTDSGGIQEEAPALGKPVLVLRDVTERTEGVDAGTARLVGTRATDIVAAARELLVDDASYDAMSQAANPYGDGFAAARIVQAILTDADRATLELDRAPLATSLGGVKQPAVSRDGADEDSAVGGDFIIS
ncbi:MAG: non-hydrolyzing UDP-N-acetylglucosamine 2-epimerase [Gaiellaceae bacterium]